MEGKESLLEVKKSAVVVSADRESLLKGKDQYCGPPNTNQFGSADFHTESIYFCKTAYLSDEVNCTEPSPSVIGPCCRGFRPSAALY